MSDNDKDLVKNADDLANAIMFRALFQAVSSLAQDPETSAVSLRDHAIRMAQLFPLPHLPKSDQGAMRSEAAARVAIIFGVPEQPATRQ